MKSLFSLTLSADDPNAGDYFPSVDLSPCTGVKEIRFFVGMVPVVIFPFQGMREVLASVLSCQVQTIVLDFIDDGPGAFDEVFFRGVAGLDAQLKRIATEYEGVGKTVVKLSANDPFVLGPYLTDFGACGILVFGSRAGDSLNCGDIQWFTGDDRR